MVRAVAVALSVCLATSGARAQGAGALDEARRHFERGSALFNDGDAEQALDEFRAAYSLSQAPGLLFNMGQAARALRRWEQSTAYFRAYLREVPNAPEREYVEEQLLRMAPLVAAQPPRATTAPVAAPPRSDAPRGRGLKIAGIGSAGAGAALVATAVVFGVRAGRAEDDVSRAFREGAVYGPELEARYRTGRRDEKIAVGAGIAGGALVVGGAVLFLLGVREQRRGQLVIAPRAAGAVVGWSCVF